MTEAKHRAKLDSHEPAEGKIEPAEGVERETDGIGESGAGGREGFEDMAVFPEVEGAGLLEVDEEFSWDVLRVDGDPTETEREPDDHTCAGLDPVGGAFDEFRRLVRRNQELQSIRPFVEGEDRFDGCVDIRGVFKENHIFWMQDLGFGTRNVKLKVPAASGPVAQLVRALP